MHRYIEAAYPQDWRDLGPDQVTEVIELGITVAESYGITVERDVGYYIDLMFYLTFDFPDLKEAGWIRKILRSRKLTGTEKMAQVRQRLGLT